MSTVKIRAVEFGKGMPKICVPMTSRMLDELLKEVSDIKKTKADIVEWRVDYFADVDQPELVVAAAQQIRKALGDIPLLFTFRSKKEGGEREMDSGEYVKLNIRLAESGYVDAVDMELFTGDDECKRVIETAHNHKVTVIMSSHDFDKTPAQEDIESRLFKMRKLGADIPKIALMPKSTEDILTVLKATSHVAQKLSAECPIITMSMGALGAVSRVAGEVFGSCMTFGTVKQASAPGQIEADRLHLMLQTLSLG